MLSLHNGQDERVDKYGQTRRKGIESSIGDGNRDYEEPDKVQNGWRKNHIVLLQLIGLTAKSERQRDRGAIIKGTGKCVCRNIVWIFKTAK